MRFRNRVLQLAMALYVLSITASTQALPYRPQQAQDIVDVLPAGSQRFDPRQATSRSTPLSRDEVIRKSTALIAQAYQSGDPRDIGQAEALMAPYAKDNSADFRLLRANIFQATHRFEQAKQQLNLILKQSPNQPDSLFMLSSINMVQGNFAEARRYCGQLQDMSLLMLKMICVAQVDGMTGKLKQSAQTIRQLLNLRQSLTADQQQWLALITADMALRLDDAALAQLNFEQMDKDSAPALATRADWLLAHQQWEKTRTLLAKQTDNDSLLLRLLISERQLKSPQAVAHGKLLGQRISLWKQRGETAHQREQAQYAYVMGDFNKALQLARLNWQKQRETADIVIYSQAAKRTNSAADLKIIRDWIQKNRFEYPLLTKTLSMGE